MVDLEMRLRLRLRLDVKDGPSYGKQNPMEHTIGLEKTDEMHWYLVLLSISVVNNL